MKKCLAVLMILTLALGTIGTVFAGSAVPTDVAGTRYEQAVSNLITKGVLSGYDDGTFRPEQTVNRAEICVLLANAMGATEAEISGAADGGFHDLVKYDWARGYINYAASKGIVNGYGDGTFQPEKEVSGSEFATLMVSALGYKPADLTGTWPENFINKATELGIFATMPDTSVPAKVGEQYNAAATNPVGRGDAAVMLNNMISKLGSGS